MAELLSCGEVEMAGAGCARVARDSLDTWLGAGAELEPEQWPSCPHLEVLTLAGGGRLGAGAGQPMTIKYGPVSRGQYCLAADSRGQSVALTCDPCQDGEVACIDLCCPHGEVGVVIPAKDVSYPAIMCRCSSPILTTTTRSTWPGWSPTSAPLLLTLPR